MFSVPMMLILWIWLYRVLSIRESYLGNSTNTALVIVGDWVRHLELLHAVFEAEEMHNRIEYL